MDRLPGIRPRQSLGRRLDMAARWAFPATSTALMLLAAAAPLGVPGQAELQMVVALASIFFWSLFRPAAMPPIIVFAIGLLCDLLGDAPPGVGVLCLLVVHGLAVTWRRVLTRVTFWVVWLTFALVGACAAAIAWALTALLTWRVLPTSPVLFQSALGAGLYPGVSVLLTRAHQSLAAPERA